MRRRSKKTQNLKSFNQLCYLKISLPGKRQQEIKAYLKIHITTLRIIICYYTLQRLKGSLLLHTSIDIDSK